MSLREGCRVSMWLIFISLAGLRPAQSQTADFLGQDAAAVSVVRRAPFSAVTVTTLHQTLGDGTRIERKLMGKAPRHRVSVAASRTVAAMPMPHS